MLNPVVLGKSRSIFIVVKYRLIYSKVFLRKVILCVSLDSPSFVIYLEIKATETKFNTENIASVA